MTTERFEHGGKTIDSHCIGYCSTCQQLVYSDSDAIDSKHAIRPFRYCPDCGVRNETKTA